MAFGPGLPIMSTPEEYLSATKNLDPITFDRVVRIAQQYCIDQNMTTENHGARIDRGRKILDDINDCAIYLQFVGRKHRENIINAIERIPAALFENNVDIVDWGCGQGLATILLAEQIGDLKNNIKTVTLIEPSEIALSQAKIYVKQFLPDASIFTHNKCFNNLTDDCFNQCRCSNRIHLFANIIDVGAVDLYQLVDLIKSKPASNEYYVCVSPAYDKSPNNCFTRRKCTNNCRLTKFINLLGRAVICDLCTPRDTSFEQVEGGTIIKIGYIDTILEKELQRNEYKCIHSKSPTYGYSLTGLGVDVWPKFKIGTRRSGGTFYKVSLPFNGGQIEAISDDDLQEEALRNCVLLEYDPFGNRDSNYYRIVRRVLA